MKLFDPVSLGDLSLRNRIVMAPMTRSRAIGNVPNELMATYYKQRASAGLIVTEGIAPSPNALGYARIPGLFSDLQVRGWRLVTDAVHESGGRIVAQLMHVGRIAHRLNLPSGAEPVAPSAVKPKGQMYTDASGLKDFTAPRALESDEISLVVREYVDAARHAMDAGFDGIELHGANGYLIEQFLNPATNLRADGYAGSIDARNRFALEVAERVTQAIGAGRVGLRLSPGGTFNDMALFDETAEQYEALARDSGALGLAYLHLVAYEKVGETLHRAMKDAFKGGFIINGGLTASKAAKALNAGLTDAVAFGTSFLANPDLPHRLREDLPLNPSRPDTFYTPGENGYTDYPTANAA